MELDFIAELEKTITNAGSEVIWKRKIGGIEFWFSPITIVAREVINETFSKVNQGINIIGESKRLTLSYAIVGVNGIDFSQYRHGAAVFPILDREKKKVNVTLDKYLYEKMRYWGDQFLDDVFSVYGDLLETHAKENVKEVKFENKDPAIELEELQKRANSLRASLGLPKLVEEKPGEVSPEDREDLEASDQDVERGPDDPSDFNPFKAVPKQEPPPPPIDIQPPQSQQQPPPQPPQQPAVMTIPAPVVRPKQPVPSAPVVKPLTAAELEESATQHQAAFAQSPSGPVIHRAQPSVPTDVIEEPMAQRNKGAGPPLIDRPPVNRNPRFNPPRT